MEKTLALFHEHGTRKIYITMYSEVFHWAIKTQREYNFVIFQSCQLKIIDCVTVLDWPDLPSGQMTKWTKMPEMDGKSSNHHLPLSQKYLCE